MSLGVLQGVASAGEAPKPDGPRNARQRHAQGKPKLLFGLEEAICLAPCVTAGANMLCCMLQIIWQLPTR